MKGAGLAIGLAVALAGCSEPIKARDIPGEYTGTLGDGQAYRLEMGEDGLYRFCPADETGCAPPADRGRYQVLRLGSASIVEFRFLCITFASECANYDADARLRRPGAVEIAFVDHTGKSHVFVKRSEN